MPIDRNSPTPLKEQILDDLLTRLRSGEFAVGQRFPSMRNLSKQYEVAEMTVMPVVQDLQRAGYLVAYPGKGTFVQALPDIKPESNDVELLRSQVSELTQSVARMANWVSAVQEVLTEEVVGVSHRVAALDGGEVVDPDVVETKVTELNRETRSWAHEDLT
ncbi:GntR family transcriptional regulator [Catenulispora sp. MAP12-49]|uniref:GntR family transcriptional regulator n=1 Tax=Catenulispora sp. MAP12-49 TaxID=3156302 RepID=UPI003512EF05